MARSQLRLVLPGPPGETGEGANKLASLFADVEVGFVNPNLDSTSQSSPSDTARWMRQEFAHAFMDGCYLYFSPFIGLWYALQRLSQRPIPKI